MAKDCRLNKLSNHGWWSKIKQRRDEISLFKNCEFGDLAEIIEIPICTGLRLGRVFNSQSER